MCPTCHPNYPGQGVCTCDEFTCDPDSGWTLNWDSETNPFCENTTSIAMTELRLPCQSGDDPPDCEYHKEFNVEPVLDRLTELNTGIPLVDMHAGTEYYSTWDDYPRIVDPEIGSGFYRDRHLGEEEDADVDWNDPQQPWGCRIIGRPAVHPEYTYDPGPGEQEEFSGFGMSIARSGTELIISAPFRDAVDEDTDSEWGDLDPMAHVGEIENAGVAYLFTAAGRDLWQHGLEDGVPLEETEVTSIPPKPHMYCAGGSGHTNWASPPFGSSFTRRDLIFDRGDYVLSLRGGLQIAGQPQENIQNILGIPDFNKDSRADYVVGAPEANGGDGAVYVVFRRANSLEGDYVLHKVALAATDPLRLNGVLVVGSSSGGLFGTSLAGGDEDTSSTFDFNFDGVDDVVIGIPGGNGGTGEVLILFSSNQLTSPAGGITVDTLLAQHKAALITGIDAGSEFGFNVANAGDIDGDGTDDLLIAAPNASPMFDSNLSDSDDTLDTPGLDRDLDGSLDDVTGPTGVPDGETDTWDELQGAGLVYVIRSSASPLGWVSDDPAHLGEMVISIDQLGTAALPGVIIVGRRAGDQLGGGDSTTVNAAKKYGRSQGLSGVGDVDDDGNADIAIGSILAHPRVDPMTGEGVTNGGEAYLIYGFDQAQ